MKRRLLFTRCFVKWLWLEWRWSRIPGMAIDEWGDIDKNHRWQVAQPLGRRVWQFRRAMYRHGWELGPSIMQQLRGAL